jgi:hypothetical protein
LVFIRPWPLPFGDVVISQVSTVLWSPRDTNVVYNTVEAVDAEATKRGSIFSANYNRAKEKRYLVVRSSHSGQQVAALWYQWCRIQKIPYVVCFTRKKNAVVKMDMTTTTTQLDANSSRKCMLDLIERYKVVVGRRIGVFGQIGSNRIHDNEWDFGPKTFGAHRVPVQYGEQIAEDFLALPFVIVMTPPGQSGWIFEEIVGQGVANPRALARR